jgi:TRAP-type uncharacterized transport system fused permease subunit
MTTVALAVVTATFGVICLAGALHEHFFLGPARPWERLLLIVAAFVLIEPGLQTDLIGLVLVGLTLLSQRLLRQRAAAPSKGPA